MIKEKSIYSNGNLVKPLKKLGVYAIDYFLCVVATMILFIIGDLISNTTPFIKNQKNSIAETNSSISDILIKDAKLSRFDKNGNYVSLESNKSSISILDEYMQNEIYFSCKNEDISIDESSFNDVVLENNAFQFDRVANYIEYRKINTQSDKSIYNNIGGFDYIDLNTYSSKLNEILSKDSKFIELLDESNLKSSDNIYEIYSVNKILNNQSNVNQDSDKTIKLYLNNIKIKSNSQSLTLNKCLYEYVVNDSYKIGATLYNSIKSAYKSSYLECTKDLEENNILYINLNNDYKKFSDNIYRSKILVAFISYSLVLGVFYILLPSLFKNGQTIGMKLLKTGYCKKNGLSVSVYNNILRYISLLIEYLSILPMVLIIAYSTEGIDVCFCNIFLNINLMVLGVFSIVLIILSYVLSFILKKTKQTISEVCSNMVLKGLDVITTNTDRINSTASNNVSTTIETN